MQGPQLIISWLSSLVPISLPNHQGLMEKWLACLIHNPRIHGSSPANCKIKICCIYWIHKEHQLKVKNFARKGGGIALKA